MAIQHYNNQSGGHGRSERRVPYRISDDMIREYSKQFRMLKEEVKNCVAKMRTWQQLAELEGQKIPKPPPTDKSYFVSQWLATPVRRGPVEGACGCGCGCA